MRWPAQFKPSSYHIIASEKSEVTRSNFHCLNSFTFAFLRHLISIQFSHRNRGHESAG